MMDKNAHILGIGERIRFVRKNESLPSFAEKIGVHKNTLARYEREEGYPDAQIILRICSQASINPNWLLAGEGPKNRPEPPIGYDAAHNSLRERLNMNKANIVNLLSSAPYIEEVLSDADYKKFCAEKMDEGGVVCWGFEQAREKILAYLQGVYLPSDPELWQICRVAYFDKFDSLKSGRNRGIQLEKESTEGFVRLKTTITDSALLKEIIETVEMISEKYDVALPIEKKSEIITFLYEGMLTDSQSRAFLQEKAERLFKLAV